MTWRMKVGEKGFIILGLRVKWACLVGLLQLKLA